MEKVRKDTDMRKDVEGIDSTLIMSPSKKRRTEGEVPTKPTVSNAHKSSTSTAPALATKSTSSTGKSPTNASASVSSTVAKPSSSSDGVTKPKKFIQYNSSDEEGDF